MNGMPMGGRWRLQVERKIAGFSQRFIVSGAAVGNGTFGDAIGLTTLADGPSWRIDFQWNDNRGSGWRPSRCKKLTANFDFRSGLVVRIGADDNYPHLADNDFDDLVLLCEFQERQLKGFINKYDFSLNRRPD
jgi:hypothetical protein